MISHVAHPVIGPCPVCGEIANPGYVDHDLCKAVCCDCANDLHETDREPHSPIVVRSRFAPPDAQDGLVSDNSYVGVAIPTVDQGAGNQVLQ